MTASVQFLMSLDTDSRDTVAGFLERWLREALPASDLKATTIENYTTLTRCHLIPSLGHHRLDAVTAADVQRWINAKRAAGLSDRNFQLAYAVLRQALGQATRWGEARRNVAALVDRPRVARKEATHLSPDQAQAFLNAARGDRLEAFYAVAMPVGYVAGRRWRWRWADVDLDRGTLRVARTLSRTKATGLTFTEPKTARSRRTRSLPEPCVEHLRAHRVRQAAEQLKAGEMWVNNDLVFPSEVGTPLDPRNALRACQIVGLRAGIGPVKLHTLRHTCVTAARPRRPSACRDGNAWALRDRHHH